MLCHEDAATAHDLARDRVNRYLASLVDAASGWISGSSSADYPGYDAIIRGLQSDTYESQLEQGGVWVGDPDTVAEQIAAYADAVGGFEIGSMQVNFSDLAYEDATRSMGSSGARSSRSSAGWPQRPREARPLRRLARSACVDAAAQTITDVTEAVPGALDPDPFGAGWWVRMCRDFETVGPALARAAASRAARSIGEVRLRPPVLNPGKLLATASNYREHVAEMRDVVLERVAGHVDNWMLDFDVFLKATSSITGPGDPVVLPAGPMDEGREIHHESELAVVIGRGGSQIPESRARPRARLHDRARHDGAGRRRPLPAQELRHVHADRAVVGHEGRDPRSARARGAARGRRERRARTPRTADLLVGVGGIISYASTVMRLDPGDVILTGAPPGVGEVHAGEVMVSEISGIGTMRNPVRTEA